MSSPSPHLSGLSFLKSMKLFMTTCQSCELSHCISVIAMRANPVTSHRSSILLVCSSCYMYWCTGTSKRYLCMPITLEGCKRVFMSCRHFFCCIHLRKICPLEPCFADWVVSITLFFPYLSCLKLSLIMSSLLEKTCIPQ